MPGAKERNLATGGSLATPNIKEENVDSSGSLAMPSFTEGGLRNSGSGNGDLGMPDIHVKSESSDAGMDGQPAKRRHLSAKEKKHLFLLYISRMVVLCFTTPESS